MNYILQLSGFFQRISLDSRLNPTHVSLYMAIFQYWNANHFHNPVSISRQDLMKISKISAKATYHKCIKDLHTFGYIQYNPSYNPYKGSLVYLFDLQSSAKPLPVSNRTNIETSIEQAIAPYINNINILNDNDEKGTSPINDIVVKVTKHKAVVIEANGKPVVAEAPVPQPRPEIKTPGGAAIPPPLKEVQDYFVEQKSTLTEANKFFNFYQSNGWKVGGKTPMQNWQASARNWMINAVKFSQNVNNSRTQTPPKVDTSTPKDYSEPL